MRLFLPYLLIVSTGFITSCNQKGNDNYSADLNEVLIDDPIVGEWVRLGPDGAFTLNFKESGIVEGYFGNNEKADIISKYELINNTIRFKDKLGRACPESGVYRIYRNDYYISFDVIDDNCNGRVKLTTGFWTKPNFEELLDELDQKITTDSDPALLLTRARLNMAIANSSEARSDFDTYIKSDSTNARVFVNRAGTRFPFDMKGVIMDCKRAIDLDPNQKNAYFLLGLALYELGEKEKACEAFTKSIELGFSILRFAEREKCAEYWEN